MTTARILITGAAGFVGSYLMGMLASSYPAPSQILATSKTPFEAPEGVTAAYLDITDREAVSHAIDQFQPTHIVHLAGVSTIAGAATDLSLAWDVNVSATLNIANGVMSHAPSCVLLFVGTSEVYGATANSQEYLNETSLLAPMNEYAASKAAADLALGALAQRGLKTIRFRPFNHTGPGQSDQFVVPAFAEQIARIETGKQAPVISVGNLDAQRDFLDVKDVVDGYIRAIERSHALPNAVIFNLASGIPRRIGDILEQLLSLSSSDIRVEPDPTRMRPSEVPRFVGDASHARSLLGWAPARSFDLTLSHILQFCRDKM